jgi:23S rRNA-/tRNA-specific pseudouridylate synthase
MPSIELLLDAPPCLVVNKPCGLSTQAPPGIDSLEVRLRAWEEQRFGAEGIIYLGIPHRLDRPASGAICFARNVRAARRLSQQFERRLVEKVYWVLVEGVPVEPEGAWHDRLRKLPGRAQVEVVEANHPEGQDAVLSYRLLGTFAFGSWLEVRLQTGRTHQIRVQAATRGLPILGDVQYGASALFGPEVSDWRSRAIALHARRLGFVHPTTREPVVVVAPLPPFWPEEVL